MGQSSFDSVLCVGAAVTKPPTGETPDVQLTMVYVNRATGTTFGTCPAQTHLLSQPTIDLLNAFLDSAERDFGQLVFGEGTTAGVSGETRSGGLAEAGDGQPRGLGWRG